MKRRSFLAVAGVGALGGLAGCSGDGGGTGQDGGSGSDGSGSAGAPLEHPGTLEESFATNGDFPTDESPADGYPPEFSDPPASPDADPSTFDTLDVNGETVRLAPIDVVEAWYRRGEARFVDARGLDQYRTAHVYGAVLSPAQQGSTGGAISEWPTDDRVITYCACPHHLSSIRAAGLQSAGHADVYALDDGFAGQETAWYENEYPMAGTSFQSGTQAARSEWTIAGVVDARYAGEYVWASTERQYEAAPVGADGRYELHLRFSDVTAETPIELSTPADTQTRPLGELASA